MVRPNRIRRLYMENLIQDENLLNISYSYEYDSSNDLRSDSVLSIEQSLPIVSNRQSITSQITLVDEEEKQFYTTSLDTIPSHTRLPHSSLFWPRQGKTLDNYIRECDSQTRTDVEKVNR